MNITDIIELLPDTVKSAVMDFTRVRLNDGRTATRVLLDRLLTDTEKIGLKNKMVLNVDGVAVYRHAPEIKKSYFYILDR